MRSNKMQAIITVGVSASGKSTWASDFIAEAAFRGEIWQRIERDCIRANILSSKLGHVSELVWDKWNWKWEKEVNRYVEEMIETACTIGRNIIVSDTNLNPSRLENLKSTLEELGYEVTIKTFEVTFDVAVKRDNARKNGVGVSVIAKQFEDWNKQFVTQYKGSKDCPKAVIVDIDGTLAHMNWARGPFEWDKVHQDEVDQEVFDIVRGLKDLGYAVIILSGRDGICYEQTKRWLADKEIYWDEFHMRAQGDMRKDSIIKAEIFWNMVAPGYDVKMVIDDRPQVTRMWRSIGLKVIQVGNPYIEF